MTNVYILQNIKGHRLGSIREEELEKKLYDAIKSKAEINKLSEKLQDKYIKQMKAFNQERKGWSQDSLRNNTEIQKLCTHALQVINEYKKLQNKNTNLISHNAQKDISIAESKAENITNSKKIRSLESMIKILEGKLSSAQKDVISIQNDTSKKESENLSLKSKIAELENIKSELESKVNELQYLKSEVISKPIIGGDDEKNMIKSNDISVVIEPSKSLRQYFISRKSMDQAGKINNDISTQTVIFDNCSANDENTKPSKVNTEINSKISDETSISEISENIIPRSQEIPNITPYLVQPKNYNSSLIESHSQIPIGEIGAIPAMASTLMSPLSAYRLLALLIIAVVWFVVLRCTWNIGRLEEPGFKGSPYGPLRNKKVIGYGIHGSNNRLSI
ncbi:hypothetical protein C2G38_2156805 [Gigaspora rosea]|uniref:Uncharacterized protein n=1 Tax=Gigaspora rosea TaxID=44941 RepID=A0A397W2A3_9GLOM|nr:hypothetical protein C2G38_2156805 [Gigaspora rosea]